MKKSEEYKNNNFGTLHLAASFLVMYGHEYSLLNQAAPTILGNQIHALGVKIIFLITGFLISKSIFSMTVSRKKIALLYTIKRIGRLFPELCFCLIMTAFLIGPGFSIMGFGEYFQNIDPVIFYIKKNILLYPVFYLPGIFEANPYPGAANGSLWTMPVEFTMYILFLLIRLPFKDKKYQKALYAFFSICFLIMWGVKTIYFPDFLFVFYGTDWSAALDIIVYFIIGGTIYLWNLQNKFNIQKAFFLLLILSALRSNVTFFTEVICMLVMSCCVFSLGFAREQSLKANWLHPECAYGVYLWGFPVQQCIISLLWITGKIHSVNLLFLISASITYIIARCSHSWIYKPCRRAIDRLIKLIDVHV